MSKKVADHYDEEFFTGKQWSSDKLGFYNAGYWKGVPPTIEHAQVNLIETLSGFLVERGNILDVACGKGASTKFLTKFFDPKSITGINISERQLEVCRIVAPECAFKFMSAENLEFESGMYDNILCIEAGFHFETRFKFFDGAYRVLKPGGRLAMSDFLGGIESNEENYIPDVHVYATSLEKAGFRHVRVEDSTKFQTIPWLDHEIKRLEQEFHKKQEARILEDINQLKEGLALCKCCMVYAIK